MSEGADVELGDAEVAARLVVALEAAAAAGARLLERFEGELHIETKSSDADLVTEADREAEAIVLDRLRAAFPGDGIVAEESGGAAAAGPCWYVDPLDGTTNFAHRLPHWSVSIGLHHVPRGAASGLAHGLLGVVHDPCRNETFFARRGHGAWLRSPRHGERRIYVTHAEHLSQSVVCTGFGYDRAKGGNLVEFNQMMPRVRGIRRLGSAALDLAYVAAGRLDGYWEYALQPWDWAAGVVLVREAGGVVQTMHGAPWSMHGPSACVAGPRLVPAMQAVLRGEGRAQP
jgi:myo-inositol-1(or 4)-monophosphatase